MINFLWSLPLFQALPEPAMQRLASTIEAQEIPAGVILFRQGEPGDSLYVVRSGTLQVTVTLPSGEQLDLDTIGAGEVVGEMAVLYHRPRAATVRALTASSLLRLGSAALDDLFASSPCARTRLLDAASRRLPSLHLATVPMFAGLDAAALRELDLETNWVGLTGGQTLFLKGDTPDYLYVVARGRLEVIHEREDGAADVVRYLGHGDVVGEVAIFTGEPRNATVRAIRDSELVRLSKPALQRLLERHPRGAMEMIRLLAGRVEPLVSARRDAPVSTIAIVPVGDVPLSQESVATLVAALRVAGGSTLQLDGHGLFGAFGHASASGLDDVSVPAHATGWLHELEERFAFVVFECGALPPAWTEFCLRQADLVVCVASPGAQASPGALDRRIFAGGVSAASAARMLVRLHGADTAQPTGTARWLANFPVASHHHVRVDRMDDFARVARHVAGRATGLALSGGGARTWAHVGVLRAMHARGVPVDAVGGVSAGVFTAAYCALGHDVDTVERLCVANMGNYNLLGDATLPMAAFLSGKNLVRALRKMYGDVRIEDLWLPFFCLSASLTTAQVVVHDRGPLWLAVRATTSVPGIEPPVCANGELLVDGGVLNNMPIDVMRRRCNGTVIASDVSLTGDLVSEASELTAASGWPLLWARISPFATRKATLPHVFEILARTATLSSVHHGAAVARSADVYVKTPAESVATFDWKAGTALVTPAYNLAVQALDEWAGKGGRGR